MENRKGFGVFTCNLKSYSGNLVLQIKPFKELWIYYGVETLVDKLDALFVYSLLSLECFGNIHSIVPLNASICNVARLLWLFEGLDSRKNPLKEEADGMTWDRHENIDSFQGSVMRSRARKIEEETQRNKFRRSCSFKTIKEEEGVNPIASNRIHFTVHGRVLLVEEKRATNLPRSTLLSMVGFWPKSCRKVPTP
ncbi:hypothetical protein M9H77_03158 [Catharanthus roseus]|uniref:Uncharacterized protein n=1 Tax=Catharanthus roseus TaxID=4058 RepID=A0ACC0CAL9_CATRO|nr:hypothetical protein M9H77_03158 [Catharanthus roseus]